MNSIRESLNAAASQISEGADEDYIEAPAPLDHAADDASPAANASRQRKADEEAEKNKGKPRTIRDSLNDANKAAATKGNVEALRAALNKPTDQLSTKERRELTAYLQSRRDLPEEQNEARKELLKELRKLEPAKKDKAEGVREGMDAREAALKKALEAHKGKLDPKELHTPEQRQIRSDIKTRWPDKKLPEVLEHFQKWHDHLAKNPLSGWKDLAAEYSKLAPVHDAKGKPVDDAKDLRASLKKADTDASDLAEMADWVKRFGAEFPELLRRANEWDKALRADPFGAAARLASTMGALEWTPPPQRQEAVPVIQPARNAQELQANMEKGWELILKHNVLPGIEAPEMQDAVAGILTEANFPRDRLRGFDALKFAYQIAKDRAAHRARQQSASVDRGSKSISGAPLSPYAGSGANVKGTGIRASLERASGRV